MRSGEVLLPGKGERITCIRSGLDGGPFLFDFELDPGVKDPPMHTHEAAEKIFEILEGEMMIRVGSEVHHCKVGDRLTLTPNDPHTFWNPSKTQKVRCRVQHGGRFERAIVQPDLPRLALFIHTVDAGSIRVHNPAFKVLMKVIAGVSGAMGMKPIPTEALSGGAVVPGHVP